MNNKPQAAHLTIIIEPADYGFAIYITSRAAIDVNYQEKYESRSNFVMNLTVTQIYFVLQGSHDLRSLDQIKKSSLRSNVNYGWLHM